jgi:hypothetical protein
VKSKSEIDNYDNQTKSLLSVPKSEVDKRHKEWEQKKNRKHKPKKTSGRGASRDSGGDT